jgi:glycogen debranching enzyme
MPDLVIKEQKRFLVCSENGDLTGSTGPQGLYYEDTRFLSQLELKIGGETPALLSASAAENYAMRFVYRTQKAVGGDLERHGTIAADRRRAIWDGVLYEQITLTNYSTRPIEVAVAVDFAADFRDLFEARGTVRKARGTCLAPLPGKGEVTLGYRGLDKVTRRTRVVCTPEPAGLGTVDRSSGQAWWMLRLEPGASAPVEIAFATSREADGEGAGVGGGVVGSVGSAGSPAILGFDAAVAALADSYGHWLQETAAVETDSPLLARVLERSYLDIRSLLSDDGHGPYTVAGIPIYAVLYGRDSLITALEMLPYNAAIARGTLRTLAAVQGEAVNAWRQEEPGKIIHELRPGEMGRLEEIPFGRYYGSVDSTPLFLVLVCEYYAWTGDLDLVRELLPNIRAAIGWLDTYGDSDGDGFLEYRADDQGIGLHVQSWKDSHYSMCHRSGERAVSPVAVSEVQGYAYDAKRRLAPILALLGEADLAGRLAREAEALKARFNEAFWMEDRQFLAIALDGQKEQVGTVSSDIGHCLWAGIVDGAKAEAVARRLTAPDLFSGWGIRTLSVQDATYNPMNYHNGTVWPHDNALCILGMKRYGYGEEANRVVGGLLEAVGQFTYARIPELFCGFDRAEGAPVPYPVACSPQAWSAAAPFAMVQAMLGLEPDAPAGVLRVRPTLPEWLGRLAVKGLRVGAAVVDLEVTREGGVAATVRAGQLQVVSA